MTTVTKQSQAVVASVVKANQLTVANLEKLVDFQLAAVQSYVDLGVSRLKAAAEVSNVNGLQAFYADQVKTAEALRQKLVDDSKALAKIGAEAKAEFNKLAQENYAGLKAAA